MANRRPRDPVEALAQRLDDLQKQITDLSTKDIIIPVVNADPGTAFAGNIWAYPDGKLNVRLKDGTVKQYSPVTPAAPTVSNPTPTPQPVTHQGTWTAQWGQAYRASGAQTGGNNTYLYQGNGDSFNGRQRSLIGFDYASIQSALSGANVTGVRLYLTVAHTWWNSGGTFWFGLHNNTSKPGTWGGTIGRDFVTSNHVPKTGTLWINLSTEFGSRFRDGSAKGITLQAPSDDRTYYGYAYGGPGTNSGQMPVLQITYVK